MNKKLLAFLSMLIVAFSLWGCSAGSTPTATASPAAQATGSAKDYTPVATVTAAGTINVVGVTYSVQGATNVTSEKLENDIVRFKIDGDLVQGAARYPLSIYQGQPWGGNTKFDGINSNLEVVFPTTCGFKDGQNPDLTTSKDVTVTCKADKKPWTITAIFHVAVLSTTSVEAPAPVANIVPWSDMKEGNDYLFCPGNGQYELRYKAEGDYNDHTESNCEAGRLLNKLAYRVFLYDINGSQPGEVVTMYPDNAAGGYAFVSTEALLIGRVYYVCPTQSHVTEYFASSSRDLTNCSEGVYMGQYQDKWQFNVDGQLNTYTLTGAFPSPRP